MIKLKRFTVIAIALLFLFFFADSLRILAKRGTSDDASIVSEEALNDHYALRYFFYDCRGLFNRLIGKRNVDKFYKLDNGHLVYSKGLVDVSKSVDSLLPFYEACEAIDVPVIYVHLPRNIEEDQDLGKFGVPSRANENGDHLIAMLNGLSIPCIDMREYMCAHFDDFYDAFYRTDHHWKASAGLFCAQTVARILSEDYHIPLAYSNIDDAHFETTLYQDFWVGEIGRATGIPYCGLEDYELIRPAIPTHFHITIPSRRMDAEGDFSVLLNERLLEGTTWKRIYDMSSPYYCYLFGNDPLQVIENPDIAETKLLVVKDSFAQTVNPFLAMTCNTLVSWDLRYNEDDLYQYIQENDIDAVVIVYNESALSSSKNPLFSFMP